MSNPEGAESPQLEALLDGLRASLGTPETGRTLDLVAALAPDAGPVSATEAVDLLERACTFGPLPVVEAVWNAFEGDFAYTGWALALALRRANEDVARFLIGRGVDLLGEPRRPRRLRALLPHEGTFTRFDLTRESPTLFLNNMDHTVATEVFEPFSGSERLAGEAYAPRTDVAATCGCVLRMAQDGLFDTTVFDDLFRAAMVRAWRALRHADQRDTKAAEACLALGREMLALHHARGMGDANMELVLGNLIVPRVDKAIVAFICENAPSVFLGRLRGLAWLQDDVDLVCAMVPHLLPGTDEQNAALLRVLAKNGRIDELEIVAQWPHVLEAGSAHAAIQAASAAGHAEAATWLLALSQGVELSSRRGGQGVPDAPETGGVLAGEDVSDKICEREPAFPAPAAGVVQKEAAPTRTEDVPAPHDVEKDERTRLAAQVLELAQDLLLAESPFLASSLALLACEAAHLGTPLATNGKALYFDPDLLLALFQEQRQAPVHDLAHVLAHCLMLHPLVDGGVGRQSWNLAADLVAEALAAEMAGPRPGTRGKMTQAAIEQVEEGLEARITTERLYRALEQGAFENARKEWSALLMADDHAGWYPEQANEPAPEKPGETRPQDVPGLTQQATVHDGDGHGDGDTPQEHDKRRNGTPRRHLGESVTQEDVEDAQDAPGARPADDGAAPPPRLSPAEKKALEARWRREARRISTNLAALSRRRGGTHPILVENLAVSEHEQVDYREFLRQFAHHQEEMHLSEDEFDYVFYTYGLDLFGDMPLIEPLEWRDEKRIHDFVIVIDTSSSVTHQVVQEFVNATFDVLTSESSFFQKVNVHIVQADLRVRSDTKISSLPELDAWRRNIRLVGGGGTDFRPAFRYVNELLADGEFDDLAGLIYFTDGWGIYPERMPPYKTTFVFFDEDHRPELVPAWALQITLHPGEFESMSVY